MTDNPPLQTAINEDEEFAPVIIEDASHSQCSSFNSEEASHENSSNG